MTFFHKAMPYWHFKSDKNAAYTPFLVSISDGDILLYWRKECESFQ